MMACRYLWLIASACLTTALHAPHRRGATLPRRATAAYASVADESPASADAPVASSVEHVLAADAPPLVLADHDVAPLAAKEALPPADAPPLADAAVAPVEAPASSFIDRHPLAAKSLSMGITYGLADTAAQFFGRVAHGEIVRAAERNRRCCAMLFTRRRHQQTLQKVVVVSSSSAGAAVGRGGPYPPSEYPRGTPRRGRDPPQTTATPATFFLSEPRAAAGGREGEKPFLAGRYKFASDELPSFAAVRTRNIRVAPRGGAARSPRVGRRLGSRADRPRARSRSFDDRQNRAA